MKRLFINIVSFSMMIVMFFAVMGLQLHYHTCGKTGERTFEIIETPHCACETESVVHTESCCHSGESNHNSCSSNKINEQSGLSISSVGCCQDEIYEYTLKSAYLGSIAKQINIQTNIQFIHHFNSIKLKYDEYLYKLNKTKEILLLPRDIVLEIIRIIHCSDNRGSIPLSL
ncbi:MAG: hypothetical protein KIT33_01450 [Candidatus Kapabacteria bacterium]|nr:hypothetical protein [Ignavibacteriota bacterium]MCW5883615.1 hypothetical protein [Candidatus Kapabacteria bacterium]